MWLIMAALSALFAGLTAILAKCGIKKTDSDVATALRTVVVLLFAWIMVFIVGSAGMITEISAKSIIFLILSGFATGASWICYFKALSVGDAYFQHKSFDRIRQFRAQGTTILLVSHDKGVIQSICDRAILLSEGRIAMQGAPDTVMDYYNALLAEREARNIEQTVTADGRIQTLSGSGEATLEDIQLLNPQDEPIEVVEVGQSVTLQIRVRIHQPIDTLVFGYLIKDRLGQSVYGTNTHHLDQPQEHVQPGETITCRFAFQANLGPGNYSISTAHVSTGDHLTNNYEWRDLALLFTVVNLRHPHFEGSNWLPPTLQVARP